MSYKRFSGLHCSCPSVLAVHQTAAKADGHGHTSLQLGDLILLHRSSHFPPFFIGQDIRVVTALSIG